MSLSQACPSATRSVLVVDDNADVRELIAVILRREGHRVSEASHGAEALDVVMALAADQDSPALIFLDLMMPVMDGATFIVQLRARGVGTPVIVVTASGKAVVAGAQAVVSKPIQPERLLELVRAHAS